jgi:hypothetical protein
MNDLGYSAHEKYKREMLQSLQVVCGMHRLS